MLLSSATELCLCLLSDLTISAQLEKTNIYSNNVDPDETARNEPSHQDLNCLLFGSRFMTNIPIYSNEHIQIQRCKSPLQKLRDERANV